VGVGVGVGMREKPVTKGSEENENYNVG